MDEVNELATELAGSYSSYFNVDVSEQEKTLEEFVEDCLTHLEEVSSVWDAYKGNSRDIGLHLENLTRRNVKLKKLFDQIDALEEYMFQTNQLLSQLEFIVDDLGSRSAKKSNKIRKIIDMIGFLGNLGGPSFVDEDPEHANPPVPLEETLSKARDIETSFQSNTLALQIHLGSMLNSP